MMLLLSTEKSSGNKTTIGKLYSEWPFHQYIEFLVQQRFIKNSDIWGGGECCFSFEMPISLLNTNSALLRSNCWCESCCAGQLQNTGRTTWNKWWHYHCESEQRWGCIIIKYQNSTNFVTQITFLMLFFSWMLAPQKSRNPLSISLSSQVNVFPVSRQHSPIHTLRYILYFTLWYPEVTFA